jgi:predicted nucleic acid-binding Zn ribbon protein
MRDEPLTVCPKCKKKGVKRLVGGGAGLIFKGSGFYITDYKKKTGTKDAGESKPSESKSSGDSKPSTPSTSKPSDSSKK